MIMKTFVFDLDFTVWNAGGTWCESTRPRFVRTNGQLRDEDGRWLYLYPEVYPILEELKLRGHRVAIASRTNAPTVAKQLLKVFGIDHFFEVCEVYPGSKVTHLARILKGLDVAAADVVFFDDESRDVEAVRTMGIEAVLVKQGLTREIIQPYLNTDFSLAPNQAS